MVNWDCYPNVSTGGVYIWEKILIESMPDWHFAVFNLLSHSGLNGAYTVPKNVVEVIELPLYGSNRYEEFVPEKGRPQIGKIIKTSDGVVREKFLPIFREFLSRVISDRCEPSEVANSVVKIHDFFMEYDCKKCLESPRTWDAFTSFLRRDPIYKGMRLNEVLLVFQVLQRSLQILSLKVPKADVVHCALAWTPALVAIIAKEESECPVIVSEHGVALKELLLYYNSYTYDKGSKVLLKLFTANIVKTIYWVADIVIPVCDANAAWERNLGVDPAKIRVIYNGIDSKRFRPIQVKRENPRPTVVFVGRIDIFKDVISLLIAISYVKREIPHVLCLIYGEAIDLEYSVRCLETVETLQIHDNVRFMGKTREPEKAYNSGDVIVVSSITEGFPFAVIEAMACGRAVVSTDVGGVREALEGCGLLVRSRNASELAKSIVSLLKNEDLRKRLGAAAQKKAIEEFTLAGSAEKYKALYEELLISGGRRRGGKDAAPEMERAERVMISG